MAKILIVDDEEDFLLLMRRYLDAYGLETEGASSSIQARHCLERTRYDAVVSDLNMPGESGLDLLAHVSHRFPGLSFILMTGSRNSRLKREAMRMGSAGYLEKPFDIKELLSTLRSVLGPAIGEPGVLGQAG
jgi:DNA-binding NtrC family response regulator